jgi:hypothetical protein
MPNRFYSDNDTGTPADALKAVGLAEVLMAWLDRLGRASTVIIEDKGGYYELSLAPDVSLELEDIKQVKGPFAVGLGKKLIKKPAEKEEAKADRAARPQDGFPYEERRAQESAYFARLKTLAAAERERFRTNPEEFGVSKPDSDLGLYKCLNHFKVADAYNALCLQWEVQDAASFQANLALVLEAFSQHPNATEKVAERWDALSKEGKLSGKGDVTLLQVVNPASGKGGNNPKANGIGMGNLDGFWLIEYLKFVGFFTIAAPLLVQQSKDRKTYVLHPVRVALSSLRAVMHDFRESFRRSTAVKLDILAALHFTQTLTEHIQRALQANERTDPLLALANQRPSITDIGRGFDIAFYKDMGSAYATMNLATINLPGWLAPIVTSDDAAHSLKALEEHSKVIRSIALPKGEEGSEELELLRRYRDFVSGHDSEVFFEFAARYGDYYLGKRYRNQWAAQFTTEGITTLMAQAKEREKLSPILENEGFQAIAAAIRRATVIAQFQAAREGGYPYEVRYGLGQQLLRAAAYPEEFMAALSEFLQSYNAENARIAERIAKGSLKNTGRNRRAMVQTEHIKEIVRLVDLYASSELICKMLVAYGYARDPYTPEDKTTLAAAEGEAEGVTLEEGEEG